MATQAKTTMISTDFAPILPDWPAPANVGALVTTRGGGRSRGVFESLNLGDHVGDEAGAVAANRELVYQTIGVRPVWLNQVHGTRVVDAAAVDGLAPEADAAVVRQPGLACTVMTADCLPVLFCDEAGTVVAAAHAGWRGLLAGVLESTVVSMNVPAKTLMAWLGPAIGPTAFKVGGEVRDAFIGVSVTAEIAFQPAAPGKWWLDIYQLARQRLAGQGVTRVYGGGLCTVSDAERFFSYRREGQTGRMAAVVWLKDMPIVDRSLI